MCGIFYHLITITLEKKHVYYIGLVILFYRFFDKLIILVQVIFIIDIIYVEYVILWKIMIMDQILIGMMF
jgi:hypothetical protein